MPAPARRSCTSAEGSAVLSSDRNRFRGLLVRSLLLGAVLGVALFAAGSLILYEARGALSAAGGLVSTFAISLAAGMWAGAPAAHDADGPPAARWLGAGLALAFAGVVGTLWQVQQGEQYGTLARAVALLFLVGVPVYAVGFLLPALVAWESRAATDEDEDGEDDASLTLFAAGVAAAGALAGLGAGAALAGLVLLPTVNPGPLMLAFAAALTAPLVFGRRTAPGTAERLVHEAETPYGTLRVAEIAFPGGRQPELRLYQDDEIESGELTRSGAPTFAYIAAAERWLAEATPPGRDFLFLGGGAYTLPRRVAERDPTARITVVELDPEVTRAAYRFFGLRREHGVASLHGDARRVAEALPAGSFDRIFVDVYDGTEHTPHHLVTLESLATLRGLLRPGGRLLMNVIGVAAGEGHVRLWSTVRTAAEAFPEVRLYCHLGPDYPERQNFLLAAAAEAGEALPGRAGHFEPWPRERWPVPDAAVVLHDREEQASRVTAG